MNQPTARNFPTLLRRNIVAKNLTVASPDYPAISVATPDAPGRKALEACIADKFATQYGARIETFLPYLVSLSVAGEMGAVAGLRPARSASLFLEQYLDVPVEQAISRAHMTPVDRDQVVEIGNLVSVAPGAASLLFGLLPGVLARSGLRWVVCTATPQVRAMLDRLGFPSRTICNADPEVLGEKRGDWGTYYDSRPQVIVGDVLKATERAASNRLLQDLVGQLHTPIEHIASALRAANA